MLSIVKRLIFFISFLYPLSAALVFDNPALYINGTLEIIRGTNVVLNYTIENDLILLGNPTGVLPKHEEVHNIFLRLRIPLKQRCLIFNAEWIFWEDPENTIKAGWLPIGQPKIHQRALKWYLQQEEKHFHKHIGFCE